MRPVFVLDVSEAAIDLLSRERFIDDYCNVLTANGRSLPEIDPDESPEETDIRLYHAAVTEIQKDPAIRIADTAASCTWRFWTNCPLSCGVFPSFGARKTKPRKPIQRRNADASCR